MKVINMAEPTEGSDGATKNFADTQIERVLTVVSTPTTRDFDLNRKKIVNMREPSVASDGATKGYIDRKLILALERTELGWGVLNNIQTEISDMKIRLTESTGDVVRLLVYFTVTSPVVPRLYKTTHIASATTKPFANPEFFELRADSASRCMWVDPFESSSREIKVRLTAYNYAMVRITKLQVKVFKSLA